MLPPVLTALLALTLVADRPSRPVLVVDPGRDATLSCSANRELGNALGLVLPDVPVVQRATNEPQSYFAALSFEEGAWRFWLSRPDGTVPLSRRLEGGPGDCVAVANASAVIVDRYFSDVVWPGQAVSVAPLEPPPPLVRSLSLSAGAFLRAPLTTSFATGAELIASARVGRLGVVQLGGGFGPSESAAVRIEGQERGALRAGHYWASLAGGACLGGVDAASLCGGGFGGLFLLDGWAEGALFQKQSIRAVAPQLGLFALAVQPWGRFFEAGLSLRAGALLAPPAITVEGSDAVLRAPAVDLQAGVRLGFKNLF